jgi:hypothetical protein
MSDTSTSTSSVSSDQTLWLTDGTGAPAISNAELTRSPSRVIPFLTRGATALAPAIDIDRLWEAAPGTSSQVVTALELLKQAIDILGQAMRSADAMEADRFVQRAQPTLPKLFALRAIGEGFGVVINSVYFAFINLKGTPMRPEQIKAIWLVLRELRNMPAMSLDQGIHRAEELEASGLEVDPSELGELLENYESRDNE